MFGSNNKSNCVVSSVSVSKHRYLLLSLNNNNGYVVSTKSIPGLSWETSVWFAVTELLTVPIIILVSIVITSLDYFSVVVTLACKMNRIEGNAVIDSSLQMVIPIIEPRSGTKCWLLSSTLDHRMRYGVDKSTLWEGFSSEQDLILILLWYLFLW